MKFQYATTGYICDRQRRWVGLETGNKVIKGKTKGRWAGLYVLLWVGLEKGGGKCKVR